MITPYLLSSCRLLVLTAFYLFPQHEGTAQGTGVWRELWSNLSTTDTSIGGLTNVANNPDWPNNPTASYTTVFSIFETELNFMDGYGQRLRGLIIPPVDGNYSFWSASDDNSSIYLSTDATPANRALIAWVARSGFIESSWGAKNV